jgi:16S rRNA processing protein RimM
LPVGFLSDATGADASPLDASSADIVVLGKITAAHGLQGYLRVYPFADDPLDWSLLPDWWVGREGDAPGLWRKTKVLKCVLRNDLLIAQLACAVDRSAAEALKGALVGAPRAVLPPTDCDEYYWADLIGLDVVNTQEQPLGRVLGLLDTPANAVLRVGGGEGRERLLPFVAAVVLDVDLVGRRIRVAWEVDW